MGDQEKTGVSKRLPVLFFVHSLGGGGAEMHILRVINHLSRDRFRLSVALTCSGGSYEAHLAKDVKVHILNGRKSISSALRTIGSVRPLRRVIQFEQPTILCTVLEESLIAASMACYHLPSRPQFVACTQNPPSIVYRGSWCSKRRVWLSLSRLSYPFTDQIIALSRGVANDVIGLVPTVRNRVEVINNAALDTRVLDGANESLSETELPKKSSLILACGRLTKQKGFSYLIDAFKHIQSVIPAQLWIVGDGELRSQLVAQIERLGLNNSVQLLGFQKNPYKYMAAADVFVLSSLWEGFGNVVVEAMASGTPVVATDCPYGPGEIIEDGVNGLLVPPANVKALAAAIIRVLKDQGLRQRLSQNGQERAQDFTAQTIADSYGGLFLRLASAQENGA